MVPSFAMNRRLGTHDGGDFGGPWNNPRQFLLYVSMKCNVFFVFGHVGLHTSIHGIACAYDMGHVYGRYTVYIWLVLHRLS